MPDRISWTDLARRLSDDDLFDVTEERVTPGGLRIILTTPPHIRWWKSVRFVGPATVLPEASTEDDRHGPSSIMIPAADAAGAKLVLAKAKMWGFHTDMYEIYELSEKVGLTITLNWKTDGPDNVWGAIGSFISDVANGVAGAVQTAASAVATAVESTVGVIVDGVATIAGAILSIPFVGAVIRHIAGAIAFVAGWIINAAGEVAFGILGIIGVRQPERLLRLVVVIQRDFTGTPVATPGQVAVQIEFLVKLFQERANIKVLPGGPFRFTTPFNKGPIPPEQFIIVEDDPSLFPDTLDVACGAEAFGQDLGFAGSIFQWKINRLFWGNGRRVIGYGGPLVVFAVRRFTDGGRGCSLGPTVHYATVQFADSGYSMLAHEVAHACSLVHVDDANNLMFDRPPRPSPTGDFVQWLTNEQVFLLRASPRTSYV